MARTDPHEIAEQDDNGTITDQVSRARDQDGVDSLRDTEAEAGDEDEINDDFEMDDREATELGVDLDNRDEPEPGFG